MSERKVLDRLTLNDNLGEHVFPRSREVADSQGVSYNRVNAAENALATFRHNCQSLALKLVEIAMLPRTFLCH